MQIPNPKPQSDNSNFKVDFSKRLVRFSLAVIDLSDKMREYRRLWPLIDQLVRSATSVGANVMEAKGSGSKKDYIRYFEIALKSANETKYWLYLVKEASDQLEPIVQPLLSELNELCRIIASGILTMKGKR